MHVVHTRLDAIKRILSVACAVSCIAGLHGCGYLARRILTTGPNGPETPESVGVPYERVSIASGARSLDSYLVIAPATCPDAPVLVIYHGVQETISLWIKAQQYLYAHCVTSLVFDYSGSGNSSRPASLNAVNEDGLAAYAFARSRFPEARVYVFGHSMGNGIMLDAIPRFSRPPTGVIVANAFASLRAWAGRQGWVYGVLAHLIPDWWDNVKSVAVIRSPLLVIASDMDKVNPYTDGEKIFAAASEPKKFVLLHGFRHNAPYQAADAAWWGATLAFVTPPAP
jgi:alpha-beta hydrolase superfamily lysophospholipase